MSAVKYWLKRVETCTLVWLARSRVSSLVIAGTLAAAGLSTGVLSTHSSSVQHAGTTTTLPLSAYGCNSDPDGDGHIFCDGSVAITKLPASFGQCSMDEDGSNQIFCRGTGW